jgi:chromosome segregation ATPase
MANPRELAEQAFSLLQNALRDSEARASELDEQLKSTKAPKNRLEEQLDVLTHKLDAVEAERARWQQQAVHLEEIAEAERARVAQLKKKLEIAESGPEKLTKKEINFWRSKAEQIDTETKDYRTRLAHLRRELNERDVLIEQLRGAGSAAPPPAAESPRAEAATEIQAQVDARSRQVATVEEALNEAHAARATLKAELAHARAQLDHEQHANREAQAGFERVQAAVADREQRSTELAAELEQLRAELRLREQQMRETLAQREASLAALNTELEAVRQGAESSRIGAADAHNERDHLRAQLADAQQRAERTAAEVEQMRGTLAEMQGTFAQREQSEREALAANQSLQAALAERDQRLADQGQQLAERDQRLADRDWHLGEKTQELHDRQREKAELAALLDDRSRQVAERDSAAASHAAELERARAMLEANGRELASVRDLLLDTNREIDALRDHKQRLESELSQAIARADVTASALGQKDEDLARLIAEQGSFERQRDEMREHVAALELDLKDEKENAENLAELANERREAMTKLQERAEEAEERHEEAKYRLGRAAYFERLVKRRKGLVDKLLAAIRAKTKSNVALKAGLDGLRTYKAAAEMNQQKLLQRIEAQKQELNEAEETLSRQHGSTQVREQLATSESKIAALEQRLNAQAEVIQTLEMDVKTARAAPRPGGGGDKTQENDRLLKDLERLQKELEAKDSLISAMQGDVDDQQRKLAKLRGSESETMRLKQISEKDRSAIDALEREIATLREALADRAGAPSAGGIETSSDLELQLKEREQSVTRLMATIKEHEATIRKLTESTESWKRRYQFLATDSPDAYKAAGEN